MLSKARSRWHITAGILTVWSILGGLSLPIICALAFLFYEVQQDRNKGTQSYLDIYEWAVTVYINVAIFISLKLGGIL